MKERWVNSIKFVVKVFLLLSIGLNSSTFKIANIIGANQFQTIAVFIILVITIAYGWNFILKWIYKKDL